MAPKNILVVCGIDYENSNDLPIIYHYLSNRVVLEKVQFFFLIGFTPEYEPFFKEKFKLTHDIIHIYGEFGKVNLPDVIFDYIFFNFCFKSTFNLCGIDQMVKHLRSDGEIFITGFDVFLDDYNNDMFPVFQTYFIHRKDKWLNKYNTPSTTTRLRFNQSMYEKKVEEEYQEIRNNTQRPSSP